MSERESFEQWSAERREGRLEKFMRGFQRVADEIGEVAPAVYLAVGSKGYKLAKVMLLMTMMAEAPAVGYIGGLRAMAESGDEEAGVELVKIDQWFEDNERQWEERLKESESKDDLTEDEKRDERARVKSGMVMNMANRKFLMGFVGGVSETR